MRFIELHKELERYGHFLVLKYKEKLQKDKTVASGRLSDSFTYELDESDIESKLSILALQYVGSISEGIENKRTPPSKEYNGKESDLLSWIRTKGIKPRKGGDSESNMKRMAFAIARSIGKHGVIARFGYKGTSIIDYVYKDISGILGQDLLAAYNRDVTRILEEM